MIRLFSSLGLAIVLVLASVSSATAAGPGSRHTITSSPDGSSLTVQARFAAPRLELRKAGPALLSVDDLPRTVEAGMPSLPVKTFKVALPQGKKLAGVRIDEGEVELLSGEVAVNRSMVPHSWRHGGRPPLPVQDAPRIEGAQYPENRAQVSVQVLHGVPVAVVDVYPVVVQAGKGAASFARDARVTLTLADDSRAKGERALFSHELRRVREQVDNPETLDSAAKAPQENTEGYDYLIVSSSPFIEYAGPGSLKDLQDNLRSRDLRSRIVDVATIKSSTEGKDLQAKIRNYIRSEYKTYGIRYVLLAADGDSSGAGAVIPARSLWSKIRTYDGTWHTVEKNIPADLYYSCLDGDFDGNGNGVWGEPGDGADGADVDLVSEVTVGRMPMKTTAELQNFVTKTIAASSRAQPKSVLLMGEELFAALDLYGDDYMNQLVGNCADHGYQTNGYGEDWTVDRLYDRTGGWSGSAALAKIGGGGFSMVNHIGHSDIGYNMRMSSYQIKQFKNARPFFYYTQGCFPGNFTANDCFIELLVRHAKGAVAAVANTSYGLGPEDPDPSSTKTPGASQMLHRRFIDTVFAGTDSLGRANQLSKEAFLGFASAQEMRWVFWDANYFGDPSLRLSH